MVWAATYQRTTSGTNLSRVDWLPDAASNISFYRRGPGFGWLEAYEFNIAKEDFIALAKERGWLLRASTEDDEIMRYTYFTDSREKLTYEKLEAQRPRAVPGLFYEVRAANGGGTAVLYDETKSRAYVQSNHR